MNKSAEVETKSQQLYLFFGVTELSVQNAGSWTNMVDLGTFGSKTWALTAKLKNVGYFLE